MKSKEYRVVFFGTSDFAEAILKDLINMPCKIVACVTRPDKPTGRHLKLSYSPVKKFCIDNLKEAPCLQPQKVSTQEFEKVLKDLNPDLFIVAAFGEIIKDHILAIPKDGSINVHPSLLPKYRGPSPIQASLMNGDTQTGVCIINVASKMDAGEIFAKKLFDIDPNDNFTTLQTKAISHTQEILCQVIENKKNNCCRPEFQDESKATYCKKISADDEKINWDSNLYQIHNKVRALSEKPGAWCYLEVAGDVKRVKIYQTSLKKLDDSLASLSSKKNIVIEKDGYVLFVEILQPEGKKRMTALEFLSGVRTTFRFN